jgi:LysR family transcriptional regulator, nitrogen assimilation regulatory protein
MIVPMTTQVIFVSNPASISQIDALQSPCIVFPRSTRSRVRSMNLRQLKYFLGVVDAGNMTRAAEQLHVAQTALGMQIRQLEDELKATLLVRHSRGVEPTKAGKLLYERGQQILKLVDETAHAVAHCNSETAETIRLGITPALMMYCGAGLTLNARERCPELFLSLVEAMSHVLVGNLARGEVDFILCYDVPDEGNFSRTALLQDDLVLVTLPRDDMAISVPFSAVLDEVLAMPEEGDTVRSVVNHAARQIGRELNIAYEVRSVTAMKNLVKQGAASSVLPYFSVIDELRDGTLAARSIIGPSLRRTLYLASLRQRSPLRCEAEFTNAIRWSLRDLVRDLGPLAHQIALNPA